MAEVAFHVEGHKELAKLLKSLGPEYVKELKAIHKLVAQPVADAVVAPRRSGDLAATVRTGGTQRSGRVMAGKKKVPYAGPIHWGWMSHNIQPQPFLLDALEAAGAESLNVYHRETDRFLDKIWATEG